MVEKDILYIPRDGSLRPDVAQHITQYLEYFGMNTEPRFVTSVANTRQKTLLIFRKVHCRGKILCSGVSLSLLGQSSMGGAAIKRYVF